MNRPAVTVLFAAALVSAPLHQGIAGTADWWNSGNCRSSAVVDPMLHHNGKPVLHIVNPTARAPNVYGTTSTAVRIKAGEPYRITVWAKGRDLHSAAAINIAVDPAWNLRPIALPAGTFPWRKFTGTFKLPASSADIRIISEDRGEAWINDLSVEPLKDDLY